MRTIGDVRVAIALLFAGTLATPRAPLVYHVNAGGPAHERRPHRRIHQRMWRNVEASLSLTNLTETAWREAQFAESTCVNQRNRLDFNSPAGTDQPCPVQGSRPAQNAFADGIDGISFPPGQPVRRPRRPAGLLLRRAGSRTCLAFRWTALPRGRVPNPSRGGRHESGARPR